MPRAKEPFAKISLGYLSNPKVAPLLDESHAAQTLHLASILYACQNRTDGRVPVKPLLRLANASESDAKLLLDAGLWEDLNDGSVSVHDFGNWQTTNAERAVLSEAGKRGGRPSKPKGLPNGLPNGEAKREEEVRSRSSLSPDRDSVARRAPHGLDPLTDWLLEQIPDLNEDEAHEALGMSAQRGFGRVKIRNTISKQRREGSA